MKKYYSRTFRIGRISVSLLVDEVIILYRGDQKVYLKKINHFGLPMMKKPVLAGLCVAVIAAGFSCFPRAARPPGNAC